MSDSDGIGKVIAGISACVVLELLKRQRGQAMTFDLLMRRCGDIDAETLAAGLEHLVEEGSVRRRDWGGVERFEVA